ncbi:MAG: nitrogenase cofactor biosynthesis protein NifB [Clostridia bacterium]|nr:nitrogenase cofactor biosynthesis protein NifB [Clostridia bacterium]
MKNRNFVNLNINPCKMCMPIGAVTAFKGIENSMFLLHGSQGCSTYIRRHMASHYNEPIDIASSSLNEKGTVFGGESNLKKGLKNVLKQYTPDVVAVATTCLAETIGEDIQRLTQEFIVEEGLENVKIIPISTPGYGGTEFEGYYAALTQIVKEVAVEKSESNGLINIIAASLSPGDIRNIKDILTAFGIGYVLLPDISDTLDAPYTDEYRRIPSGGTKLRDIEKMTGAVATIEMGMTVPSHISPGQYLLEKFNVPFHKCAVPIGIENTDKFIRLLSSISQKPIPQSLKSERGRLLDGMIDSHKYNSEGRAVLYGDPELVYAASKLCMENGIKPVLIATGTQSNVLRELLKGPEDDYSEEPNIIDDTDFETIQRYAKEFNANIIIGNSDGKVITEKEGIPLVRFGFPIHDRVGGQRLVYTGYTGTQKFLDDITNTLLEEKYTKYRKSMYKKYFNPSEDKKALQEEFCNKLEIARKTMTHPCYSKGACKNARMHIPVAPACNISCNYCNRKFDCVNESRPGVTSEVLTPEEAAKKFVEVKSKINNLKVLGIAGPGDALANFKNTKKSIELIKEIDPDVTFCLSTNGLMLPFHAEELISLGVTHITITINAIDPEIGAKIYKEVNFMGMKLEGVDAAALLIKNQLKGLRYLSSRGVVCKVNIVMIKGINDTHIEEVVKEVKKCGAFISNIMPLIPAKGSAFENLPLTNNKELNELRKKCEIDLKQMYHCKQCRADAIGMLSEDISQEFSQAKCGGGCSEKTKTKDEKAYTFAVATRTGVAIDQHFGHAEEFYIFKYSNSEIKFVEKRLVSKYCTGEEHCDDEDSKIDRIVKAVNGCNAVLVLRIGYRPSKILQDKGIVVVQTCGRVEDAIKTAVKDLETVKELAQAVD